MTANDGRWEKLLSHEAAQGFTGELLGTFILVFFGIGSIAVTVLFSAHSGLLQVALMWGIGVSLAIYCTRHLSCAHLNPAVSLAMVVAGRMSLRKLPYYWLAQVLGAFAAGMLVYGIFSGSIASFELVHNITRGADASVKTAMMFGEYFPNPGAPADLISVSLPLAFLVEALGTALLVITIFMLTEGCNVGRPSSEIVPILIGLTVTAIIGVLAPLTQAGLNPARDFGPRLFAYFADGGMWPFRGLRAAFLQFMFSARSWVGFYLRCFSAGSSSPLWRERQRRVHAGRPPSSLERPKVTGRDDVERSGPAHLVTLELSERDGSLRSTDDRGTSLSCPLRKPLFPHTFPAAASRTCPCPIPR